MQKKKLKGNAAFAARKQKPRKQKLGILSKKRIRRITLYTTM